MTKRKRTNAPTPARGRPACPPHVQGEARAEWERITDELDQMGTLCTVDRATVALYCVAWGRWVEAEQQIYKLGLMVAAPKTKTPMHNPYRAIADTAHVQVLNLAKELGLTPRARAMAARAAAQAAAAEPEDEPGDFDDL